MLVNYNQSKNNKNSSDWFIHSYQVLHIAQLALVDVIDLTNNKQNYIRTGYPAYREAYKTSLAKLDKNIEALRQVTIDNPEQQNNLNILREKIERLKEHGVNQIASKDKKKISVYSLEKASRESKLAIGSVRAAFDNFSKNEAQLLDIRAHAANAERTRYIQTLVVGGLLALIALVVANMVIFSLIGRNSQAREKLRDSEELFARIIDGINDGVFDYDVVNGTILYSPAYKVIWGYGEKELTDRHEKFYEFVHPDDLPAAQEIMRQYFEREIPTYHNVFRVRHKDGRWVWVMSRGVGVWDKYGNIQRLIGTHTDITSQKQREEELNFFIRENEIQRAELAQAKERAEAANQAKSDFLATISHEIRTPMNAVVGLSNLLLQMPLNNKQCEMVETLNANADVLLTLVNDLLDLSRIEAKQVQLEFRSFTLEEIFKSLGLIFEGQAKAKNLALLMTNNLRKQRFIGDAKRIQQILVNLISNALKFTPQGHISIVADLVSRTTKMAYIKIDVTDTGVGVGADKLTSIFEKFVQADQSIARRFGGSGLGLSICQSLAQLMGGDITATSLLNKGSTFTFSVPLQMDKQERIVSVADSTSTPTPGEHGTVLVVEDYLPNVMVATMILEHLGYGVDVAKCGAEAINKIVGREMPYAAILMDVQMQDMDGFETTRRIRLLEKEKGAYRNYIIGVTAHALVGDRDRCLAMGMDEYISKPVHLDVLSEKLGVLSQVA